MTLAEAAERLHCSTKTVRRRIRSGELRASRVGRGLWQIRDEDLGAYLDARANRPRDIRPLPAPVGEPIVPAPRRRPASTRGGGLSALVKDIKNAA